VPDGRGCNRIPHDIEGSGDKLSAFTPTWLRGAAFIAHIKADWF
jgi:hypothetical protein